ncbi:MAG: ammonium transporter [Pseudomonadota bacterium]
MTVIKRTAGRLFGLAAASALVAGVSWGQAVDPDILARIEALEGTASPYVDNTFLFLFAGLVVMFMAAGFMCLEAGLVRSKNAAMQSMKNIGLFSVAGLMFWLIGYNLLYPGSWAVGFGEEGGADFGVLGAFDFLWSADNSGSLDTGYSAESDWYFQMVFVATAASIVSGTVAERVKLWPFLLFTAALCGLIYPIQCSWQWGGGWLSDIGFSDFAGSTLVHSVGGWAALVGAIVIGPRIGKYFGDTVNAMPGSNIPLAGLGTFILWFGWFGFNGGSQLAMGNFDDVTAVSTVFVNTNMAAVGGVLGAMILTAVLYKGKVDATMVFNGAIGGLVSITAEPLTPSIGMAVLIGAIGGFLVVLSVPLLDKLKIDDVVGAIPAHLVCGIWGTLAVPLTNSGTNFGAQIIGIVSIGAFVVVLSAIFWLLLKYTMGVRLSDEDQELGLDRSEVGLEAYPEFAG